MTWRRGDPAPVRPSRDDPDYVRKLERYASNIEDMLIWLARNYPDVPTHISLALLRMELEKIQSTDYERLLAAAAPPK
jgi:hypothetical protein